MGFIVRNVIRYGVIGTLAGGAVVLIAGPERTMALLQQVTGTIHGVIDGRIDDPVALRSQLRTLEAQYPQKIQEVRTDLAALTHQKREMQDQLEVDRGVIGLVRADIEGLQSLLARAEDVRTEQGGARIVRVRYEGSSLNIDQAYGKANQLRETADAFQTRVADMEKALGYVEQQEHRLAELLTKLEAERADFQARLWALERDIDTVARNDRLIVMMKERQETIDRHSRYRAASLDQLTGKFAEIRARQESELQSLSVGGTTNNYEQRARAQIDARNSRREAGPLFAPREVEVAPEVIEVGPEHDGPPTPERPRGILSKGH